MGPIRGSKSARCRTWLRMSPFAPSPEKAGLSRSRRCSMLRAPALAVLLLTLAVTASSARRLKEEEDHRDDWTDEEWKTLGLASHLGASGGGATPAEVAATSLGSISEASAGIAPMLQAFHRIFPSNVSGTFKGTWEVVDNQTSDALPDLRRKSGNIIFQIKASETARHEIHFLQGEVVLRDGMYISDGDVHMKLEGVYIRTWGELRMLLSSGVDADLEWQESGGASSAYKLALQDPSGGHTSGNEKGSILEMSKNCRVRMVAHVTPTEWDWKTTFADGVREHVPSEIHGVLESPRLDKRATHRRRLRQALSQLMARKGPPLKPGLLESLGLTESGNKELSSGPVDSTESAIRRILAEEADSGSEATADEDEEGPCFATLRINATAVDLDAFYNKAVNYTLMVTFVSFLQVLFIIRQMEHSNTQSGAAKVSMLMVGQQAIMDAYLCLLHLTAGIVVESLFNAFATAAFFKFVIFSIFEMRYLLAIWKARRPSNTGDSWDAMRRELSVLYSRFYGFLLGGILLLYRFNSVLRYLLLIFYSFWIPQIVTSAIRDSRKPLHVYYIIGISLTRLAVPLYIFGCPRNFMRMEPNYEWCAGLILLMAGQVAILLLQHYFGPRCFIPRQFLPEKYCYYRRIDLSSRFRGCPSPRDENCLPDCVICMAPVTPCEQATEHMVTPCEHVFHARCLQRWMDIKMECPTCRRTLPPL